MSESKPTILDFNSLELFSQLIAGGVVQRVDEYGRNYAFALVVVDLKTGEASTQIRGLSAKDAREVLRKTADAIRTTTPGSIVRPPAT